MYFADFRADTEERLDGEGTEVGDVLADLAARHVAVFGLIWRSQPGWLDQSEGKNAELARTILDEGGQVLLDPRTRRGGSHHQKFVVIRHPGRPADDVAFVGGIDLGLSRNDDGAHLGDPQVMDFPAVYGERPPWHDVHCAVAGPAVTDVEHTFRERWYGSSILDLSSPIRMVIDRAYMAGQLPAGTCRPSWTTRRAPAPMPSRSCAPTRPACAGTRSPPLASAASTTPTARCSSGSGASSISRTSTCGPRSWPICSLTPCGPTPTCG